jgi:hypothetical protein
MQKPNREAKLQRAKPIGRIAYRYARDATIIGFIEVEGERKFVREFVHGAMSIEFYEAAGRAPCDSDFSQLRVHHAGRRSL